MPAPPIRQIHIYTGSTYVLRLRIKNKTTGLPIDISGRTYTAQLRPTGGSATLLASFVAVIEDGLNGIVSFTLPGAVTTALPAGMAAYDVLEVSSGVPRHCLRGPAFVDRSVTE